MRALVTGGAGFIGSHLVDALIDRGDEVSVVDDLSTGRRENLEGALGRGVGLHEVDIRDRAALLDVMEAARPEIVFHLAAQIDVRKSTADPAWDAGINVLGTINLLQASLEAGVDRFVNTSTGGAIYGEGRILPAPEDHPQAPEAPYDPRQVRLEQRRRTQTQTKEQVARLEPVEQGGHGVPVCGEGESQAKSSRAS